MNRILLALQFWEGDQERAMKLARLITDMQPGRCENADFLFMARFDCQQDLQTIEYVSSKFNVFHYINRHRRGVGWPHGCNDLWFGTIDWVYGHKEANKIPDYKAILTFEADCVPLSPNWVSELSREWDRAKAKVVGAMQQAPGPHINGNAMFSGDLKFLYWLSREVSGCNPRGGWDYVLAPEFKRRGWAGSSLFQSDWGSATMPPERMKQLLDAGVVFHHGTKDESALRMVRERFVR